MTIKKIEGFHNSEHSFLSNFYPSELIVVLPEGQINFPTVEHAYQAYKTNIFSERKKIASVRYPGQAKRLGKRVTLREDFDNVKLFIMYYFVRTKFFTYPHLAEMLVNTGQAYLEETNNWNDTYWGVCKGVGSNWLGVILMRVRKELIEGLAELPFFPGTMGTELTK